MDPCATSSNITGQRPRAVTPVCPTCAGLALLCDFSSVPHKRHCKKSESRKKATGNQSVPSRRAGTVLWWAMPTLHRARLGKRGDGSDHRLEIGATGEVRFRRTFSWLENSGFMVLTEPCHSEQDADVAAFHPLPPGNTWRRLFIFDLLGERLFKGKYGVEIGQGIGRLPLHQAVVDKGKDDPPKILRVSDAPIG